MNQNSSKKTSIKKIIKNIGARNVILSILVFALTIAATAVGGVEFYQSVKESIYLQGKMNSVQSAKEFDNYLLVRMNTVMLAAHVVDEMVQNGAPNSEILDYITAESLSIKKAIDMDYTGIYGWVNHEYLDGVGWVPDEDYVPTERPWYLETIADDREMTFVRPYVDDQTKSVVTTLAKKLSDGVSVIALDVTLDQIQVITEDITDGSPGSIGIVLDKTGQVIAHSDKSEIGKNYLDETGTLGAALAGILYPENGTGPDPMLTDEEDGSREFDLHFNHRTYRAFAERIEGDWNAVSLIDTRAFYGPLKVLLMILILMVILEAIVFIVILGNQSARNLAIAEAREAQNANEAKSQFLSRMSHEIRTPINAIIGLDTIALRDESISSQTREELTKIGTSARHLLSIINDILDMSRIESGRTELKEEVFSFREFLEQICIIAGGQCEDKGLQFICDKTTPLDQYFLGDSLKLKQAIINILGNSVKFTDPPGEITLTIRQETISADQALLCFTMKDTGIGMDPEFIPRLFDAFSQEDTATTTRYGGSGLGMAITKSIVEMMGGEIRVESEKGRGTTFFVSVRMGRVTEADAEEMLQKDLPSEEGPALEGLHILIVEDQEMNAEVLADLLELEGMTSEWAENGQIGVDLFVQSEEDHFDAILMDMRMPVMDGITATKEIRLLSRPDAARIPIIALTANAFEEDVRLCLQAGMNEHLSKPVDIDKLKQTLGRLLKR